MKKIIKRLMELNLVQLLFLLFIAATITFILSFAVGCVFFFSYQLVFDENLLWGYSVLGSIAACFMLFKPIMKSKPLKESRAALALGLILSDFFLMLVDFFNPEYLSKGAALLRPINFLIFWIPYVIFLIFSLYLIRTIMSGKDASSQLALSLCILIAILYAYSVLLFIDITAFVALIWLSCLLYVLFYLLGRKRPVFLAASFLAGFIALLLQNDVFPNPDYLPAYSVILLFLIQSLFVLELYILSPHIRLWAEQKQKDAPIRLPATLSVYVNRVKSRFGKKAAENEPNASEKPASFRPSLLFILGAMVFTYLLVALILSVIFIR